MVSLYKLRVKILFKNPFLVFDLILPLIFILVFGSIIKSKAPNELSSIKGMSSLFGVILSIIILNSGMYSFGYSFFAMKESILLKRIGASKISKSGAIMAFILSGFTVLFFVLLWAFFITFILSDSVMGVIPKIGWKDINWLGMIVAIIIGSIASYSLSLFFVSIFPNSEVYNSFVTFYFFIAIFLGGSLSNLSGTSTTPEWMTIIGKLTPVGWNTDFLTQSILGANPFNFGGFTYIGIGGEVAIKGWETALNIFIPLIIGLLCFLASTKTFKWDI